jgi:hypothetical protein
VVTLKFQRRNILRNILLKEFGDVLDFMLHQNDELVDVTVFEILHTHHLPIILHILDHVTVRTMLKNLKIESGFKTLPLN